MRCLGWQFDTVRALPIAAAMAAMIATGANAQLKPGGFTTGPSGPIGGMGGSPGFHGIEPRMGGFNTMGMNGAMPDGMPSGGKFNGPVSRTQPGGRHPGSIPPGRRPPGMGPIGPAIGTGVVIGTVGPVVADPSSPPPPQLMRSGPPAQRSRISIPPNNETRFVTDEVLLEFPNNTEQARVSQLLVRDRKSTRLNSSH